MAESARRKIRLLTHLAYWTVTGDRWRPACRCGWCGSRDYALSDTRDGEFAIREHRAMNAKTVRI